MSRKRWIWGGVAVALIAVGVGTYAMQDDFAYANMAAGFVAKQTCSCRFVSGRTMASCVGDLPANARSAINVTQTGKQVRATMLFGTISSEAAFEEGYGCSVVR